MEWMNRHGILVAKKQGIYYRIDGTILTASKDGETVLEYHSAKIGRLKNKALEHNLKAKPKSAKLRRLFFK
jgi:hypothetical protein